MCMAVLGPPGLVRHCVCIEGVRGMKDAVWWNDGDVYTVAAQAMMLAATEMYFMLSLRWSDRCLERLR